MSWPLVLGALWALALLTSHSWLCRNRLQLAASTRRAVLLVAIVAAAARLVPNFILPKGAGYDIKSYQIVGNLVLQGQDVYTSPQAVNRHPYLPFQMYWMALARWLSNMLHVPFVKVVRLAPIGADVAIALLIFLYLYRSKPMKESLHGGLLYAVNPIPVFVSAYHGQFDAIPSLFLLLAVVMTSKSNFLAGGWLGLGILSKSWPVLALPSLWAQTKEWRRRLLLLGGTALAPLIGLGAYLLLFQAQARTVLSRALGYNWGVGVWGYTYLFRLLSILKTEHTEAFTWLVQNGRYLTLTALGLVWLLKARKEPLAESVLTILVTFFAVTHAFSIQYLMWVVPFAVLNQAYRWLHRYTLSAFAYMFLAYMTLILEMHITNFLPWPQADWFIIMPAGLPAWLVAVGWMRERIALKEII